MSLAIEKEAEVTFDFDYETLAKDVISITMEHEHFPFEAEISLTLTDNEGIWKVNKEFREIDRPTDVLSFPMLEYDVPGDFSQIENQTEDCFNPDTGEILLGDIIISVDKVREQAEEYGHSMQREFAFLIVHSMLHLFGYDHMEEQEAAVMEGKQREILECLNILR